jgi:hypothetical protein
MRLCCSEQRQGGVPGRPLIPPRVSLQRLGFSVDGELERRRGHEHMRRPHVAPCAVVGRRPTLLACLHQASEAVRRLEHASPTGAAHAPARCAGGARVYRLACGILVRRSVQRRRRAVDRRHGTARHGRRARRGPRADLASPPPPCSSVGRTLRAHAPPPRQPSAARARGVERALCPKRARSAAARLGARRKGKPSASGQALGMEAEGGAEEGSGAAGRASGAMQGNIWSGSESRAPLRAAWPVRRPDPRIQESTPWFSPTSSPRSRLALLSPTLAAPRSASLRSSAPRDHGAPILAQP